MFCPGKPFILVGNKCDTRVDKKRLIELEDMGLEQVTELEAINLYEELGAHCYIESSAYCNIEIKSIFQECLAAACPVTNYKFEYLSDSTQSRHCSIQ